jgi:AcrR family transcriptional regulator
MKKTAKKTGAARRVEEHPSPLFTREGSGPLQKRAEKKLGAILTAAAALMARHGFNKTSIRDVARETGCSLAGMYYYFASKEELLFQIQRHTFASLLAEQKRSLAEAEGDRPEERFRRLVMTHLAYFTSRPDELKVCGFELESLTAEQYEVVRDIRRDYYRLAASVVAEVMGRPRRRAADTNAVRHATMLVFGMLNWIYMWYDPKKDGSVEALGEEMIGVVLDGLRREGKGAKS